MKWWFSIGIVLMVVLAGCGYSPDSPALTGTPNPPAYGHPLKRGKAAHEALEEIDSLMWRQPDSAFAMLQEFASSAAADGLDEFDGHYCQMLISELLYKNDYGQSNRTELMAAIDYFDSVMTASDQNPNIVFLDARAHYMNGVGFYEHDSLPEACAEYLRALRIMESRFSENELVGKKARFMALTHNRLMELFSHQFMQEPAIYCGKQSVAYDRIAHSEPIHIASTLLHIGQQYAKIDEYDSAAYYYDLTLSYIPDRNTLVYRDWVSLTALNNYNNHRDTLAALDSLKSMMVQASDETEMLTRFMAIGSIYHDIGQYDSAKYYWEPVFELEERGFNLRIVADYLREIALKEGDTLKVNQYAQVVAKNSSSPGESQARVSKLNDLFQSYLLEKQEAASVRARKEDVKKAVRIIVPMVILMALAIIVFAKLRSRKLLKEQQAVAQKELEERERQHAETVKKQQEEAIQQARMMLPQRVNDLYRSKVSNRMERILEEFEAAYPYALERLAASYPDLNKTETYLVVLSFLQFRAKEEADLLGLSENTVMQYRSNLRKKTANASFSEFFS